MEITYIYLERLRNDAHFQFHTEFKRSVEEHPAVLAKVPQLFEKYVSLYNAVDAVFKEIVKSTYTAKLQETDKARDTVWRGLCETINTALTHFDPQVQEAATHLKIVIKTYGNVAKKTLNEQTSATYNILQELEGQYAQHVAKVGLLPWVVELKARNIAFANLMQDRAYEKSSKIGMKLKKARAALDEAYYEIVKFINSLAVVEGLAVYEPLIKTHNVNVAKYHRLVQASKKGKKGKKEAAEDAQT